jgi:hypothetical protein
VVKKCNLDLIKKHPGIANKLDYLIRDLNLNRENNSIDTIEMTKNNITLTFNKKWNYATQLWTISNEKEQDLIKFLGVEKLSVFDEKKDFTITGSSSIGWTDEYFGLKKHLYKVLDKLNDSYKETSESKITLNNNGVALEFEKKLKNGAGVWTVPIIEKVKVIKFFELKKLEEVNTETDLIISGIGGDKNQGLSKAISKIIAFLNEESTRIDQQKITLTQNNITIQFIKKINKTKPTWTIPKNQESELSSFFNLENLPIFSEKDLRISQKNTVLNNKYQGIQSEIIKLIRELNAESLKDKKNIISKTKNGITLSFTKKWYKNNPIWTLPRTQ